MRKALIVLGWLFSSIGLLLIVANIVLSFMGLSASYNLGDPTKYEFVLVPLWQIGLAVVAAGGACLLTSRWLRATVP
jgi:hypothetical protein